MKELFEIKEYEKNRAFASRPLAFKMRPESLDSFVGQNHLIAKGRRLRSMIDADKIFSVIFYGPPGCGKSALAHIIASQISARIKKINAVNSNVKEIRKIALEAKLFFNKGEKTLLIIDEIHRFNKSQQESLLPDVEDGTLILVGITTENPFYFVVGPLLSRTGIYKFKSLNTDEIKKILLNTLNDKKKGLGNTIVKITDEALNLIASQSSGDARYALNILELAASSDNEKIDIEKIKALSEKKFQYDRAGDKHYDTISAFIKSIRGSDPDAVVFYLAKMISSGEDPRFIARRIIICASEDIGNADPMALVVANATLNTVEHIGMPEARITLAQAAIYAACAPKSNASYKAIDSALKFVHENPVNEVPFHLTKAGAKKYKYPHDYKYGYVNQDYRDTTNSVPVKFYQPVNRGHEKYIIKYLSFIKNNG